MAKELPWFKFYPDEWLTGDITLEEESIQGLFITVCAYYWKKDCDITIALLKKRYRHITDDSWSLLFKTNSIKVENETVKINFLDEQWRERQNQHEKKSKAGKAGANKRWQKDGSAKKVPLAKHGNIEGEGEGEKDTYIDGVCDDPILKELEEMKNES